MHPATLGALGVLLVNDLVFKALWPGAWVPGKLSDLAWMIFAPPVLAYVLSFATTWQGRRGSERHSVAAYAGLPLLYVAFNTISPVHDVVLHVPGLGWRRRTSFAPGPDGLDRHSPLRWPLPSGCGARPPLEAQSIRTLASRYWRRRLPPWQVSPVVTILVSTGRWIRVGRTASGNAGSQNQLMEAFTKAWTAG